MSDASLGHILEDVQDVQNIARMQEESKNLLHERLNDKPSAYQEMRYSAKILWDTEDLIIPHINILAKKLAAIYNF